MTPKPWSLAVALTCAGLWLATAAHSSDPEARDPAAPWTVLEVRAATGEQCLVCRQVIHDGEIVAVRYKGRTFHVAESMLAHFESDPESYFQSLEAHSALFDESAAEGPPMRTGWLWFGLYVLGGLVSAALCGYLALGRGLPALPWFAAGLLVNVLAVAALLTSRRRDTSALPAGVPPGLSKIPTTRSPVRCASCGGANHPSARRCGACGGDLSPEIESEAKRALSAEVVS